MKKKVLIVSTYSQGGAGKAANRLYLSLIERDNCLFDFEWMDIDQLNSKNKSLKFKFIKYFKRKIRKSIGYDTTGYEIFSDEFGEIDFLLKNYDIVHLHWISGLVNYKTFFRNVKSPIIWTLHDLNPLQGGFHYRNDVMNSVGKKIQKLDKHIFKSKKSILSKSNIYAIVSPSKWINDISQESEMFSKKKHLIIPNGLDTNIFTPHDKILARALFKLDKNKFTIMFSSENVSNERKGFDLLLNALNKIDFECQVLIIGFVKNELIEKIDKSNIKLIFSGKIEDDIKMAMAYSSADVFIIPSREDNLPNVLLESFSCGTPVISFDIGGMKDFIIPFFNGLVVQGLDSNKLSFALVEFDKNRSIYQENRTKIHEFARDNFSLEILSKNYIELYKSCINQNI